MLRLTIERFHSRGQHTCKFPETKGSVNIRKEFNSQSIGLVHQHGRRFIVLEHQYGCRYVMGKRSIQQERRYPFFSVPTGLFFVVSYSFALFITMLNFDYFS